MDEIRLQVRAGAKRELLAVMRKIEALETRSRYPLGERLLRLGLTAIREQLASRERKAIWAREKRAKIKVARSPKRSE